MWGGQSIDQSDSLRREAVQRRGRLAADARVPSP